MGGHSNTKICEWIQENCAIPVTEKECESLVSFVGLFLPFESEMGTLEEDFLFVQERCNLIPPPAPLMREWATQVKLMERKVRIARGYIAEKPPTKSTRHSAAFAYRFPLRKRGGRKLPKKTPTPISSRSWEARDSEADSDDTELSRDASSESPWESPRSSSPYVSAHDGREIGAEEESKESQTSAKLSSTSSFTRVIMLPEHSSGLHLNHLDNPPEEKIEECRQRVH